MAVSKVNLMMSTTKQVFSLHLIFALSSIGKGLSVDSAGRGMESQPIHSVSSASVVVMSLSGLPFLGCLWSTDTVSYLDCCVHSQCQLGPITWLDSSLSDYLQPDLYEHSNTRQ